MKNAILSFAFLLFTLSVFSQSEPATAQSITEQLTEKYNLTADQQKEMLIIQERKMRNLAEIEDLKKSNTSLHIQKMRALKSGIDASMERLLTTDQLTIYRQEKAEFRKQKSNVYSELKSSGASQQQIDYRISELEEAALLGKN